MKEISQSLENFRNAFDSLGDLIEEKNENESDVLRDAVIKRFEFTYEVSWKLLKRIFERLMETPHNALDTYKLAYKFGLINGDNIWTLMREKRNILAHTYRAKDAEEIYHLIKTDFYPELKYFKSKVFEFAEEKNLI